MVITLRMFCVWLLTAWIRVLLEKLSSYLVKKLPTFMELLRFITAFARGHHLSLFWAWSNPVCAPIPLPEDSFEYYPPIYACVFHVVSFSQVSPPKPCMRLSPIVLHALPISVFSIWSPEQDLVRIADHVVLDSSWYMRLGCRLNSWGGGVEPRHCQSWLWTPSRWYLCPFPQSKVVHKSWPLGRLGIQILYAWAHCCISPPYRSFIVSPFWRLELCGASLFWGGGGGNLWASALEGHLFISAANSVSCIYLWNCICTALWPSWYDVLWNTANVLPYKAFLTK